jgi:N-acetylmuramoyl-L-alanine amidase
MRLKAYTLIGLLSLVLTLYSMLYALFLSGCATVSYKKPYPSYSASDYINIEQLCKKHNFQYRFDTVDDMIRIFSSDKEIRLVLNSRVGYFNSSLFTLNKPPLYIKGIIAIPKELDKIVLSKERIFFQPAFTIKTIVVDPGHGGGDPGAISPRGLKEKDLNLIVSKYLKEELEKRGFKVILTRSRDTHLTLGERVSIAKRYNADLFLSVHTNSNRSRHIRGVEIYYLSSSRFKPWERAVRLAKGKDFGKVPFDAKIILWDLLLSKNYAISVELAHFLQFTFKNLGFKVFPPKRANFYVLRLAYVPSVLVEIGYISNRYEEKILRKKYYQKQIAEAIALGVVSLNKRYISFAEKK